MKIGLLLPKLYVAFSEYLTLKNFVIMNQRSEVTDPANLLYTMCINCLNLQTGAILSLVKVYIHFYTASAEKSYVR